MELTNKVFYLDGVKIISKTPIGEIRKGLPLNKLESFCKELNTGRIHYKTSAGRFDYKSWIEFSVPEKEFFKILNQYDFVLREYHYSKVEIAKDRLCDSESESLVKFKTEILEKYIRKYTKNYFLYDAKIDRNPKTTKEKYGDNTLYFMGRCKDEKGCREIGYCICNPWNFAAYARLCKVKKFYDIPTVHSEFRLYGAGKIKKYTGLKKIKDGINFDAELTYELLEYKFITKCNGINFDRLGRFIGNYSTQVEEVKIKLRSGKYIHQAIQMGRIFCGTRNIQYPYQLWETIKSVKIEAKKTKGRPHAGTLRFKKLSASRFKSFFVPEGYVFKKGKLAYNKY